MGEEHEGALELDSQLEERYIDEARKYHKVMPPKSHKEIERLKPNGNFFTIYIRVIHREPSR